MSGSNLVVVVTGSIAAYKACEVVSQLVQRGHRVRVVASPAALKFVGGVTWEGLTGERVRCDLFESGAALDHIELSRWASLILICPATANTLNRVAAGLSDDLPSALLLAADRRKPVLAAPAMNPAMWQHPATVESVARLRSWGYRFIDVGLGRTACGELGLGRLAEPGVIVAAVESALAPSPLQLLRILVTSGPTAEPIDRVRLITNASSGETGTAIAEYFRRQGHHVVLLRGRGSAGSDFAAAEGFGSGADLALALETHLRQTPFDAVIHAAAVSDFKVESIEVNGARSLPGESKLSSADEVILHLGRAPKLVDRLRPVSRNPRLFVIAFKLTAGAPAEARDQAVRELFARSGADLIVHNDLNCRQPDGRFPAELYRRDGTAAAHCENRAAIAPALEQFLLSVIPPSSSHAPVP
jgi:phosphopantothenoylcysteine decarboxylase/phosphopantothenate--cysteine ligase